MENRWNPDLYQDQHSFVWQMGTSLVAMLDPQPGERILDLGCGTGQLTQAIAERGAIAIGLDADPLMVAAAQQRFPHLNLAVADARSFTLSTPVDAIFSNATLHWVAEAEAVIGRMDAALKPGGRLVLEFGGSGNMAQVVTAIAQARENLGFGPSPASPWYFPTIGEYTPLLEQHGFTVHLARLYDRPTPLTGANGLTHWLTMFASRFWADLTPPQVESLLTEILDLTHPHLYRQGQWWADYRRLQIVAHKPR